MHTQIYKKLKKQNYLELITLVDFLIGATPDSSATVEAVFLPLLLCEAGGD